MLDKYKHKRPDLDPDYFDKFNQRLSEKLKDEDMIDIEKDAPILFSLKKETGMSLPDHYFENAKFADIAMRSPKIIEWNQILAIAASLIILISAILFIPDLRPSNQYQAGMESLDDEEAYLSLINDDAYLDEILPDQLIEFDQQLDDVELDEIIEANLDDFDLSDLAEFL